MYSPLHYSAQAHSASDGESDTVSVPVACHPGLFGAESTPRTEGEQVWGGRGRPGLLLCGGHA